MKNREQVVCCIGLGAIGLPSACFIANSGYKVYGVDNNRELLEQLQQGKVPTNEPSLAEIFAKVHRHNLLLSTSPSLADIYLLIVPTILNENKTPNTTKLFAAVQGITPLLKAGDLVIIESTCPIGVVSEIQKDIAARVPGVLVAYCPERIMPGNIIYELEHNARLVGADDPEASKLAQRFYQSFVKGEVVTCTTKQAEAVKLLENVYRDINIAFANELSMAAEQYGLEPHHLIKLANLHPRVNILQPGVGVGGYCIQDNPWFLISDSPASWTLATTAREVNTTKTAWVIKKITDYMQTHGLRRIACFGATYKANVGDTRKSPALEIIQKLQQSYEVCTVDPYLDDATNVEEAIEWAELLVGLVPHEEFKNMVPQSYVGKPQLDFAGVFV
jgi:UDP-N-acetyl-D-mannosaminuronic acid dehydrogenase